MTTSGEGFSLPLFLFGGFAMARKKESTVTKTPAKKVTPAKKEAPPQKTRVSYRFAVDVVEKLERLRERGPDVKPYTQTWVIEELIRGAKEPSR